jgi:hypothetical protein
MSGVGVREYVAGTRKASPPPATSDDAITLDDIGEFAHQLYDLLGEALETALPEDAIGIAIDMYDSVANLCDVITAFGEED